MTQIAVAIKHFDVVEAQARLDALPGSNGNFFEDMTWQFENQRGNVVNVDFNDLIDMNKKYFDWPLVHTVDWILLNKRLLLSLASKTTISVYVTRLSGLKLFWSGMAHLNLTQLTRDNCTEFLKYLLMHSWRQGNVTQNLTIKSHNYFNQLLQLQPLKLLLSGFGLNWINRDVTASFVIKQLKSLIPELTDEELSFQDWQQGGSYNLLTLDHGRYYVEHCLTYFEQNYPLASALASTFQAVPDLAASSGLKESTISQPLPLFLQGYSVEDIKLRWPTWSITSLQMAHNRVVHHFESAYEQAQLEAAFLQDDTLETFVLACGLEPLSENIDRMRVILWDWLHRNNTNETHRLLDECNVPWEIFEKQFEVVKTHTQFQPCIVPSVKDYQAIGLLEGNIRNSSSSYPRQLINLVAKAGLTSMVALTGWRRSEFGFPSTAIKRTRNSDKLDQYAFPWRYQLDWYVYKTSGNIRQLREVTFNIVSIAERLQAVVGANDHQPCLCALTSKSKNHFDSKVRVSTSVQVLWGHFVAHYSGFKQLDDWAEWQALEEVRKANKTFTKKEQLAFERLLGQRTAEQWTNYSIDINLKEAWRRAREEWPQLELFLIKSNTNDKKNWLSRYCDGTLRPDWHALLESYLPDNTKDWLHSLTLNELKSQATSKTIMNVLIEGTLYPSPHAFRHMWAEAIYRRFDGDAGWMIRSQFKHISRAMWLDYIRNKDNHFGHEKAKERVISSLVHNYLRHHGEGYAGQLHVWLRRLFNKTSVLSPEEQEKMAERLATIEIENIKSSPWGYCLLKRRTRSYAKCAEMGEPMRHNASPDLCLGCVHNLMQTENVDWALFHVASHVEALKNPLVPAIFKASSFELVKNVTRHVRTLNPQHEALTELQEALDNHKSSGTA